MNRLEIFNILIDNVTMDEAIAKIDKIIEQSKYNKKHSYVVTPNVDHIVKLEKDELFLEIYNNANLVLADGMPIIWSSKILNKKLKEKVSGSDLFPILCKYASEKGYRVYFLGGREGIADKAADYLKEKNPNLIISGVYSPPFGFENDEVENNKILEMINLASPDILFVGLGAPKQEKWIYANKDRLNVPISLGIGASFDFIAGSVKRAPIWMQKIGLEWFFRFLQEPKRMFKRYFIDDIKFIKLLYREIKKQR